MARLNLSNSKNKESSASSSSEEEERAVTSEQEEQSEDEEESDEEFEIPPGFEPVKGSSAITRDAVLSEDKELWFFKLPKHMDASALANVSFKVKGGELGDAVASVTRDGKKYQLQHEDVLLTQQLVNAFPLSADRKKFSLAKPFSRVFSLVEDRSSSSAADVTAKSSIKSSKREAPVEDEQEVEVTKSSKKSKKSKDDTDEREKAKATKKAHKSKK